jgi:sugar lactone lactonase YvrE
MAKLEDALKSRVDTKANQVLFSFFLAMVLVLVGVRLWSDARYRAVPVLNQIAASADGIAIACGKSVYVFSLDGVKIRTYALPDSVKTTQLFWDEGSLFLADMDNKNVLVLNAGTDTTQNFTGPALNAQFKVIREPGSRDFFVSDSANHRILVFDQSYRYLRSFGQEGNGPGDFRFPNDMAFDESDRLLIANTKRSTIDVYRPDGQYVNTLVKSAGDRVYRYPTAFIVTSDRLLVLENDGYLERGKVRVYDRKGVKFGELDLGGDQIIGGLSAYGNTIYLTDSGNQELKTFSLTDLHPLGTFSYEFDAQNADWRREAAFYHLLSLGSLIALLLFCAPIIILYLKIKKEESKVIALSDLSALTAKAQGAIAAPPADLVLRIPVNPKQQKMAIIFSIAGVVSMPLAMVIAKTVSPLISIAVMFSGLLSLIAGIRLFTKSGVLAGRMLKQTELIAKKIVREGKLVLQPGEQVDRIAYAQQKTSVMDVFLLVFTTKRLLLYSLSWGKVTRIEQFPFESIRSIKPPKKDFLTSKPLVQITLMVNGENRDFKFYHFKEDYLRLLGEEFSRRIGKASGVPHGVLCLSCLQPMQSDSCLHCASKLTPDWTPVLLSLLFPGLGQLRNGEMQKGLVYVVLATVISLIGYIYIKGWFFEGADVTMNDKAIIMRLGIIAPFLYVSNVIDAYRSGVRARKRQRP